MSTLDLEKPKKPSVQSRQGFPNDPTTNAGQSHIASFSSYSGPIPPPEYLIHYEKMVPGIAKRFLEEPRLEAEHRRALERKMVETQIKMAGRGQLMAFSLAIVCVIGSFAAIFSGHSLLGLGALFLSIGAFIGVFIYGKNQKSAQT